MRAAAIGTSVNAKHERRSHRRNDGSGQRLVHATLDTGHAEQRQEHDDDDAGGEGDGSRDFDGG